MPANEPAKARFLYEAGGGKSTHCRGAAWMRLGPGEWARYRMAMVLLAALLLAAQPAPFRHAERSELLEFRYAWPAEVEAVPALRAMLRRRMEAARARALADARETRASSREARVAFHTELYDEAWSVETANGRFLSLTADLHTDNNGARPNRDFEALIWDRARGRATSVHTLLGAAALARLSPRYCAALNAQLSAHGAEPPNSCPPLADRVLAFSDRDHDGRFDALHVLIAPYVAASYADGSFVVDVPFARGDLEALAPADRAAFEESAGR